MDEVDDMIAPETEPAFDALAALDARVRLVDAANAPLLLRSLFADGDPGPIASAVALVPELVQPTLAFVGAALSPVSLSARAKEIIILRTSVLCACRYCVNAHTVVALDTGLSIHETTVLRDPRPVVEGFGDPAERALLEYIDVVAESSQPILDDQYQQLTAHWRDYEIVEITLTIGTTMLLNRLCTALRLPSSPETLTRLASQGLQ